MTPYVVIEALLLGLGHLIDIALRVTGGPHHLPHSNEDFVWH
ncbi:MAG TPA: hypothetical protein VFR86_14820 [Burkholderiaceae bacterium]|nr:hypothetical protein [Burkholderiaceae bacterium]